MTPQRLHILEVFSQLARHLTAEELYRKVKEGNASIGQATGVSTREAAADSGLAKEVEFATRGPLRTQIRPIPPRPPHCERCGRNVEVVDAAIEKLQEEVAARHGFVLTGHKLYLYGVCPECRKADPTMG
jgi:Fur family ferric uptake transcriptional regulator